MEIYSVLIYLTTFSLSLFSMFLSQKLLYNTMGNHNSFWGCLFLVVAILIPCFLAAIRGLNVGTDVGTYILPNIYYSSDLINNGFLFFYENMPHQTEIGFAFIIYMGLLLKSVSFSFFVMQLLTLLPVYVMLNKYRKFLSVTFGFATFYLLNYNFSLSGMRVSIAMSIILLMFYYFVNGKKIKVVFLTALAFLFHNSAVIIFFLIFILYYILKNGINRKMWLLLPLLFIGSVYMIKGVSDISLMLLEIVNPRYVYYLQEYMIDGGVFITDFVAKVVLILVCTIFLKENLKFDFTTRFLLLLCIVGRCFVLLNTVFYESMRIAYYFDMFLIPYTAMAVKEIRRDSFNQLIGRTVILLPSFFYWFLFIMKTGAYGTNLYISR